MDYNTLSITGSIIIIEDDPDDRFFLAKIFEEFGLTRHVFFFVDAVQALAYLIADSSQPFLIISDINLPVMNGLEFKRKINQNPMLREKSIPFVFVSTAANTHVVTEAYREFSVQGFFEKHDSYEQMKRSIYRILDYWQDCKHPNSA